MRNEILLFFSIFLCYGSVIVFFKLFKESGLIAWTVIATIAANIEVLILVKAFGMEQTLGNVLFASTFLVTDIASEVYGKKVANKVALVGCATSVIFIILSQYWLLYIPSSQDWAMPAMKNIFSNTPRVMFAGLVAYAVSQIFDVWIYHKWWAFTEKISGNKKAFLWFRNNVSTLMAQLINVILFTFGAFFGKYPLDVLISMTIATYVIYIITSFADTPFVYLARKISPDYKG